MNIIIYKVFFNHFFYLLEEVISRVQYSCNLKKDHNVNVNGDLISALAF